IPEPRRMEQVGLVLSDDGRYAVARPEREGALGALAPWNIADGTLVNDLEVRATPDHIAFNAHSRRLLVQTGHGRARWDVAPGELVSRIETQTEFVLPPALSADGDFVAIAERVDGAPPLFSLVRVEDGALVASTEGVSGARDWVLGPEG